MFMRQLKEKQHLTLCRNMRMHAYTVPTEASYTVTMTINNAEYAVKLQPERHNKMAVLQAVRICRGEETPTFELITDNNILSSLLEIILHQGIA